jgi:hypothetical protein
MGLALQTDYQIAVIWVFNFLVMWVHLSTPGYCLTLLICDHRKGHAIVS